MERICRISLTIGVFFSTFGTGSSLMCNREDFFGQTKYFSCPEVGDSPEDRYCCGYDDTQYCCSTLIGIEDIAEKLPVILGVIFAMILGLVVLCIVCCCLCPFCLLHKRRNRGVVHNPPPDTTVMQPLQQPAYTAQPGYTPQPGYPVQPGYPPQPGYTPQPGYPPQQGYPPQPYPPAGYPTDQPPSYSEKQPAYNPNY